MWTWLLSAAHISHFDRSLLRLCLCCQRCIQYLYRREMIDGGLLSVYLA